MTFKSISALVAVGAALTLSLNPVAHAAPSLHVGIAYDTGGVGDQAEQRHQARAAQALTQRQPVRPVRHRCRPADHDR